MEKNTSTDSLGGTTEEENATEEIVANETIENTNEAVVDLATDNVSDKDKAEEKEEDGGDVTLSRREARKIRSESKNLRDAKKKLAVENENLVKKIDDYEKKIQEFESKILESEKTSNLATIKSKFALTDGQAKYLTGNNLQELEAAAKQLLQDLGISNSIDYKNLNTSGGQSSKSSVSDMTEDEILKKFSK